MKKKQKNILAVIFITPILLMISISVVFFNEIRTMTSYIKINDTPIHMVNIYNDYKFEEYLKVGSKTSLELEEFIKKNLAYGVFKRLEDAFYCSSFTAKTPNGDIIMGRNMEANTSPNPVLLTTSPKGGHTAIAMNNPPKMNVNSTGDIHFLDKLVNLSLPYGSVDGINEHGVAIAILSSTKVSYPKKSRQITISDFAITRLILDKASSVDEAIELIRPFNLFGYPVESFHFIVADSLGNAAIIEYVNGELVVTTNEKNYIVITNTLIYNNERNVMRKCDRYKNINEVLNRSNGIITEKDALGLLEINKAKNQEVWSSVFNLTQRKMIIKFHNDDNIYEFRIKADKTVDFNIIDITGDSSMNI